MRNKLNKLAPVPLMESVQKHIRLALKDVERLANNEFVAEDMRFGYELLAKGIKRLQNSEEFVSHIEQVGR